MRCQLSGFSFLIACLALPTTSRAQAPSRSDSLLAAGILAAEDGRDSTAAALRDGVNHPTPVIRALAARALARIRDPKFATRDSFPTPTAPPAYPDPAWRLRYRALGAKPLDCAVAIAALSDSAVAVVLRAIDVMPVGCAHAELTGRLRMWTDSLPARGFAWHRPAHSLVALARLSPKDARSRLRRFARSRIPWVRSYAARAAGALADTATLRALAADGNNNVRESAIDELSRVAGHAADDVYLDALAATGYQAVRAAARALKGAALTTRAFVAAAPVYRRMSAAASETSRDTRLALLDLMTQAMTTASDTAAVASFAVDFDCEVARTAAKSVNVAPRCHALPAQLPPDAIAFAFGKQALLRVTLADTTGGGAFTVRLRGDVAPIMAARILDLVRAGWYNDRTWYRVEPDFVIQGGGPGSNEYVGHPRFMRDELSTLPQVRGVVGMSTRGHDTGDAQWFINLRDNPRLTRDYTAFGEVVDGIDIVDRVLEGAVIARIEAVRAPASRR